MISLVMAAADLRNRSYRHEAADATVPKRTRRQDRGGIHAAVFLGPMLPRVTLDAQTHMLCTQDVATVSGGGAGDYGASFDPAQDQMELDVRA
ncbi:hypothetical protein [Paracraurococcus ruber]|uniref:Uncharacterized protein n=1 Tax=Paracraurococcus ruber TaxID=77675 RepID=A0ABS1D0X9_9PROT|nr:hypothetical protein [Paracraurococcus ruber]MBK1660211.1 hypothetical protein [Paracraurococcus ruber]TDG25042.1 hypothetical protein E2C05_25785 [Paracraurococcus ruber]